MKIIASRIPKNIYFKIFIYWNIYDTYDNILPSTNFFVFLPVVR